VSFRPPAAQPGDERTRLARAVAAAPRDPAPRRALAAALARTGAYMPALDQYRALLALVPHDPHAAADAGLVARKCGMEEEVLPLVEAAAAAHPENARLWQVLGLMHRALDRHEAAIAALDKATRAAPRDALMAHAHARARFEAGKPSVRHFELARSLAPGDRSLLLGMVAALVAEGRPEDAGEALRLELRRSPDWIEGHNVLARHLYAMGDQSGFMASLEAALRAQPGNLDLWRETIVTLMHADRYEAALEAVGRGRVAAGPNLMFDANEAVCRAELGQYEAADRLFEGLRGVNDPTLMIRHVRHLLRTARPAEAERIALPMTGTAAGKDFWPYLSVAWRMTGDSRWQWLEGDPRMVGVYDIAGAIPSLDALADCLRGLHRTVHQPLEQSLRGGTQTDGYLFARAEPEIRTLRAAIVEAVRGHIAQLPPHDPRHPQLAGPRSPIRFSGSWSVRLTSGGRHANHIHPAGWFSSAFYVALPPLEGRGPAPAGWLTLGEPQAELQLDMPPFRLVEPKPGRLALFPSTMWHGTRPFEDGERLTVAFDVAQPG
jgi:tetratricopeptide (TPR) repeat protein